MLIKQIFEPSDTNESGFEIEGQDLAAPIPEIGETIHWKVEGKLRSARVRSKTYTYDSNEISLAQTRDSGLTITIIVDVIGAT